MSQSKQTDTVKTVTDGLRDQEKRLERQEDSRQTKESK